MSAATATAATLATPDLPAVKRRQQSAWSAGDYAVIGVTLQIVGESLCEALDLHAGERVLDVAAGNGNATLAAARRHADVTSSDYVPALLDRGRARAAADGLTVDFREADCEALPFADGAFDVVMSTFGVMFTPDQDRAAAEMARVCRPGGRIGLANWTPSSFIGELFKLIGRYVPPPAGVKSPALWGTEPRLQELFGATCTALTIDRRDYVFRYRNARHWLDVFRTYYGPMEKAFGTLDAAGQSALADDLVALAERFNRATDGSLAAPGEYVEVVMTRRS
ncbi:MAG: methyltransferase domain-containing protein [Betaproteobacteria bacterium]|nr:methyltransferase domain-containing protein [Betaproteobacteria bacterium]